MIVRKISSLVPKSISITKEVCRIINTNQSVSKCLELTKFAMSTHKKSFLDHPYARLGRYEKPIGAYLLFWPVAWGVATASTLFPCTCLKMKHLFI